MKLCTMKLKLEILDIYINFFKKIQNFSNLFFGINNFVNSAILPEQQFFQCNNVRFENLYKIENKVKSHETKLIQ